MLGLSRLQSLVASACILLSLTQALKISLPSFKQSLAVATGLLTFSSSPASLLTRTPSSLFTPSAVHADARLNAPSAAGTRVNSDPESLLRYGLPFDNKEARDLQIAVEKYILKISCLSHCFIFISLLSIVASRRI